MDSAVRILIATVLVFLVFFALLFATSAPVQTVGPHAHPFALVNDTAPWKGLIPQDLWAAYNLPSAGSASTATVALVEAGGAPTLAADLQEYRRRFALPPCRSCLTVVNEAGKREPLPATDTDWAVETSLDAEMVAALCPTCHILVVEADSASLLDLIQAQQIALIRHPAAISDSWGMGEWPVPTCNPYQHYEGLCTTDRDARANLAWELGYSFVETGTVTVVSSGDSGQGVNFPADLPGVIAVGGTTLHHDPSVPRGWTEVAWSGAGSGCSTWMPKPRQQTDICAHRSVADIGFVADPKSGVAIFDSTPYYSHRHKEWRQGWIVVGGTSVGAPAIAALYALADRVPTRPGETLYRARARATNDITAGATWVHILGTYHRWPLYGRAGRGYDGPTGMGSPNGLEAFQ